MVFAPYLAMTAGEMSGSEFFSFPVAWMACHFSPYGTGITNRPRALPPGSMLILNDRTPVCGHDPERVARQLEETVHALGCSRLLLDFQRPKNPESQEIVRAVSQLSCPVGVTGDYAKENDCAIFLPPGPRTTPRQNHIAPWQGWEIWLEIAPESGIATVTEAGCTFTPCDEKKEPLPHQDQKLHCEYEIEVLPRQVRFTLQRGKGQLEELMQEGKSLGISCFVGLYQELAPFFAQAEAQDTALDQF